MAPSAGFPVVLTLIHAPWARLCEGVWLTWRVRTSVIARFRPPAGVVLGVERCRRSRVHGTGAVTPKPSFALSVQHQDKHRPRIRQAGCVDAGLLLEAGERRGGFLAVDAIGAARRQ